MGISSLLPTIESINPSTSHQFQQMVLSFPPQEMLLPSFGCLIKQQKEGKHEMCIKRGPIKVRQQFLANSAMLFN